MSEDRIKSTFKLGYSAKNARGVETLRIDATVTVADQSRKAASAHLASAVAGLMGPAQKQAEA